jgi:hypothetical protein
MIRRKSKIKLIDQRIGPEVRETAAYIGDMSAAMARLAHEIRLPDLTYLLELARLEAERASESRAKESRASARR